MKKQDLEIEIFQKLFFGKEKSKKNFQRIFDFLRYYRSNEVRRFTYTRLFVHDDDRDATSDIAVRVILIQKR
jgi:hypothetical protein